MVERDPLWKEQESEFDFCSRCRLYPCELIEEYIQFRESHGSKVNRFQSYDISDDDELSMHNCIMGPQNVKQIECGNQTISDGIGDHYKIEINCEGEIEEGAKDKWEPYLSVFISAQTGQGKNYFIEHTLIPYVRELNLKNNTDQKVLILSNRLALKQQIKNRLRSNDDIDNEDDSIYTYGEFADVMTYQSVLLRKEYFEEKQKKTSSRYIFVICDEAHFFTSDAMFNPHTYKILDSIIMLFQDAIRVYMSATPYECLKYIIKYEREYVRILNQPRSYEKQIYSSMVLYHFDRDYEYLNIRTYSDFSELYGIITKSVNEKKERWLIFLDDRGKCKDVKDALLKYGEDNNSPLIGKDRIEKVLAVNADSKKDKKYLEIIKNEALDRYTYVLISTSVLDNGINLNNINNIVVSDMTKVKCLQMVGRARKSSNDDQKTLYIKRFNSGYVKERKNALMEQQDAYHHYDQAYDFVPGSSQSGYYSEYNFLEKYYNGNVKDWMNAKRWFGRSIDDPKKLYKNDIAKAMVNRLVPQYESILSEMLDEETKDNDPQNHGMVKPIGQKYLEHQLSWFGKKYCVDDDVTFADNEKAKKEFIAFLELYSDDKKEINEENQEAFSAEFTRLYDLSFGRADRNLKRNYGIRKMNALLVNQDIDYEVVSQSSCWVVRKCDNDYSSLE